MLLAAQAARRLLRGPRLGSSRSLATQPTLALVVAEHDRASIRPTLPAIAAAAKLAPVAVLVADATERPAVVAEARRAAGVGKASAHPTGARPNPASLPPALDFDAPPRRAARFSARGTPPSSTACRSPSPRSSCSSSEAPGRAPPCASLRRRRRLSSLPVANQPHAGPRRTARATHVLAASSTHSRAFLPRAAALLGVPMLESVTAVAVAGAGGGEFQRPVYAGNAVATARAHTGRCACCGSPPPVK